MNPQEGRVAPALMRWMEAKLPQWIGGEIRDVQQVPGGASKETFIITLQSGQAGHQRVIIRRDSPGALVQSELRVEFAAYTAFSGTSVPVPRPIAFEPDPAWLGRPFTVMEMIEGCHADPKLFEVAPFREKRDLIGTQMYSILGSIASAHPVELGITETLEDVAPADAWSKELDYWEGILRAQELFPQPVAHVAIQLLRKNPPAPPGRVSVIHGDYRSGNFLFDDSGTIKSILDWEMCHLGDPLEDLTWGFNLLYCGGDRSRVGRLIPRQRAIEHWEASSGIRVDEQSLQWWELFTSVKALAIWNSGARIFADGKNRSLITLLPAWFGMEQQDRIVMEQLENWS